MLVRLVGCFAGNNVELNAGTEIGTIRAMPNYPKAPITEAIIDLRVTAADDAVAPVLDSAAKLAGYSQYTKRKNISVATTAVQIGPSEVTHSSNRKDVGYAYESEDGKQIFQSRSDGFTFSRLALYDRWETFQGESRRLWNAYHEAAGPVAVTRLAVRTINRLDFPLEPNGTDLAKYLRTYPEVPTTLGAIERFFTRMVIPINEISGQLVLTQARIPSEDDKAVSIILDTDIYSDQNIPQDEGGIWLFFERLHERRNFIFEECITPECRKLFQ